MTIATSEDQEDLEDHAHDGEVFNHFDAWISAPSIAVLVIVITLGSLANSFIIYCIQRRKIGTSVINPVLIVISTKNLLAIATCIPTAIAMLCFPSIIVRTVCHIQENITFIVLFGGFFYPALLSAVQCDNTYRPFGKKRKPITIHIAIAGLTVTTVCLGAQGMYNTRDTHGCHLWSRRIDDVVFTYICSIGLAALLSFVVMGTSYYLIYRFSAARENATQSSVDISMQKAVNNAWNATLGQSTSSTSTADGTRKVEPFRRRKISAILKPMICIVITNMLFAIPWQVLYSLTIVGNLSERYDELRIVTMCILYIPIATDPIIFLTFSTKGRIALKEFFKTARVAPTSTSHTANVSHV